jgi:hypothetical protein
MIIDYNEDSPELCRILRRDLEEGKKESIGVL